jgi:murein DD-endopeptidase MepM/ murein hydrolase activator NlpD
MRYRPALPRMIVVVVSFGIASAGLSRPAAADERVHVVRRGQTLFAIARAYGVSVDRLARVNGIADPSRILAGARLTIPEPKPRRQAALPWPVEGAVISRFASPRGGRLHEGIDIKSPGGTPIRAVADGVVSISSESYGAYGRLVAIEHGRGLTSRYGHNLKNLVSEGQRVSAGEVIALVGRSGNASTDHLHFELHRKGTPIDPQPALAPPSPRDGEALAVAARARH